jgi:hypothetical protein
MILDLPKLSNFCNLIILTFFFPPKTPPSQFFFFLNKKKKNKGRNMLGWPATPFGLGVVWPPLGRPSGGWLNHPQAQGGGSATTLGQTLKKQFEGLALMGVAESPLGPNGGGLGVAEPPPWPKGVVQPNHPLGPSPQKKFEGLPKGVAEPPPSQTGWPATPTYFIFFGFFFFKKIK